jgi:hypothetical protein
MSRKQTAVQRAAARPERRKSLYESDFYSWARAQAEALRSRRLEHLDWLNLSEEVEDLAIRNADALECQAERLIAHLLKIAVAPGAHAG